MRMNFLAAVLGLVLVGCQVTPPGPDTIEQPLTVLPSTPPIFVDPAVGLSPFAVAPVVNGLEAARLMTWGGGLRRRVDCTDNATMVIQPLGAFTVTAGGAAYTVLVHTTLTTVSPAKLIRLSPSKRYWVYASNRAGAVDFSVSTTEPDAGLRYMSGNTAFFLVTTFITDIGGNVVPYTQNDNRYSYSLLSAPGSGRPDGNLVVDEVAGPAAGTVSLTSLAIPPGSKEALIYTRVHGSGTGLMTLINPTTSQIVWQYETSATNVATVQTFPYALSADTLGWQIASNVEMDQLNVAGFTY